MKWHLIFHSWTHNQALRARKLRNQIENQNFSGEKRLQIVYTKWKKTISDIYLFIRFCERVSHNVRAGNHQNILIEISASNFQTTKTFCIAVDFPLKI